MPQNTETTQTQTRRRLLLTSEAPPTEISEGIAEQRRLRRSLRAIGIEVTDLLDPTPSRKPAKPNKGRQRRRRTLDPNAHIKLAVAVPVARLALFADRHRQWVELMIERGKRIPSDRRDRALELDRNIFNDMVTPLRDKYPALHDVPRYIGEYVALWMHEEFARAGDAIKADDCPKRYFFRSINPVEPESDGYGGVEGTNVDARKIVAFRLPRVRHPYSRRLIDMGTVTCESPADDLTIGIYNGQYRLRSGTIIVNDDGTLAFEISFERLKTPPKAKPVHACASTRRHFAS
jgi:hypothetical protein